MSAEEAISLRRRFLLLRAMRWFPTGLLIPVLVVLFVDRGLTLVHIGFVLAAQGVIVLALELPTGGLADVLGRRRVLLLAGMFDLIAMALLLVADSLAVFALAAAFEGVYRALESGPLDAWYVDQAQAADPDADIESTFAAGGVVVGVGLAVGSLASGGLVAIGPVGGVEPLLLPIVALVALRVVELALIARLMTEPPRTAAGPGAWRGAVRAVPSVVADSVRMVRGDSRLRALVAVEFLWGFGMTSFETFTPARLDALAGGSADAAALLGPTNAVAWLASAAAAAAVPWLTRRLGTTVSAAAMRIAQGATVVVIGFGGIGVVIAAHVATLAVHGAANPVHQGLLHRAVTDPERRATVVSANNLTAMMGGVLGGIALGALADATSLTTAIVVGAAVLAAAAPLYRGTGARADRSAELAAPEPAVDAVTQAST